MMNQKGRSMVEILGVLAIIGVLSVGGIAGYSKAMFKYKLNKQATQVGYIVDYIIANQAKLRDSEYILKGILNKLDIVPDNMIRDNSKYIYDIFNSKIKIENHTTQVGSGYAVGIGIDNSAQAISICRNFMIMAKERADDISRVYIQRQETDESFTNIPGYCGKKALRCNDYLHNMGVLEMDNACKVCDETKSCFLFILIGYS